jgi:hypothetical protein
VDRPKNVRSAASETLANVFDWNASGLRDRIRAMSLAFGGVLRESGTAGFKEDRPRIDQQS